MLFAEGSDWFWWFGDDQESGDDAYFDRAFRELLGQVYDALGSERPPFLRVPIIPAPAVPVLRQPEEPAAVTVDGDLGEWSAAARSGIAFAAPRGRLRFAFDSANLYLAIDGPASGEAVDLYLAGTGAAVGLTLDGRVLGFRATHVARADGRGAACLTALAAPEACRPLAAAGSDQGVELQVPFALLGAMESGDLIGMAAELPEAGAALGGGRRALQVPDISAMTVLIDVEDPAGDDHGPGTYAYPLDEVFVPGSYDLRRFQVGIDAEHLIFAFEVGAPIANPWGSPRGLSVQTFDVYVDTDPRAEAGGARLLLPGRNAALQGRRGWEYAVTVEGWDSAFYAADRDGMVAERDPSFDLVVFPAKGRVVVRLDRELFAEGDPAGWGYAAALMSQEGFPSAGVRRVRDVEPAAERWRIGGAPTAVNRTRIIDAAWPRSGVQEELLSTYRAADSLDGLTADDFGRIPLLIAD